MISLKQVEAFLASAASGSFVSAARSLNTTQSNVSKRIQELEWALGGPVFERGRRVLALTVKGKQILPRAEQLIAAYNKLTELAEPGGAFAGLFRIGSAESVAMSWLPSFMTTVRQTYPTMVVEPRVDSVPRLHEILARGEIDLVFGGVPSDAYDFEVVPLAAEELVWVCHPNLLPRRKILALEQLATLPIIEHGTGTNMVSRMFKERGISVNTVARCSSVLAILKFAVSGIGVTHLPRYVVEHELRSGRLAVIRCRTALPPMRYTAAFRRTDASPIPASLAKIAMGCCRFQLF